MATEAEANKTLKFHQVKLFDNYNLAKLSVVPKLDSSDKPTTDWLIEAGVISLAVQANASAQSAGLAENVPNELFIPDQNGQLTAQSVTVRIVEVGEIRTVAHLVANEDPSSVDLLSYKNRVRPVNGGNSVGNARYNDAGTFGSVVKLRSDDANRYFISCWHVLAGGSGVTGDALIQPGRLDGGFSSVDIIGTLYWFLLNDDFDVALGLVSNPWQKVVTPGYRGFSRFGTIPVSPVVQKPVTKCGRTTEVTTGTILSTNTSVRVAGYPTGTRLFLNQIETTVMSQPGDSGSILFHSAEMAPVGLLFAGGQTRSYHNNLKVLFDTQFGKRRVVTQSGIDIELPEVIFDGL